MIEFKEGLVSVIMPAYNSAGTIRSSIESVQAQTYVEWELWIIDDSGDNTEKIVASLSDTRIHYIHPKQRLGVARARNLGISKAGGQYVAFLDSDDLWDPEKLSTQVSFMKRNGYGFTYSWYYQFRNNPEKPNSLVITKKKVNYHELLKGNDIGCLTVMVDRKFVSGIYMPSMHHEDYIAWLGIVKKGLIAYALPRPLAYYRIGKESLSSNKWECFIWTWRVYRDSEMLSILDSGYYLMCYILSGLIKHYLNPKVYGFSEKIDGNVIYFHRGKLRVSSRILLSVCRWFREKNPFRLFRS